MLQIIFVNLVVLIHVSRGQSDSYSEACPDCVSGRAQVSEGRNFFGCVAHYPNRKICRTGDPMADQKLNDYIKSLFSERSSYVREEIVQSPHLSCCK